MDRTPNFARRWDAGDLPARAGLERARANWGRIVMGILLINPPWLTKDGNIWGTASAALHRRWDYCTWRPTPNNEDSRSAFWMWTLNSSTSR